LQHDNQNKQAGAEMCQALVKLGLTYLEIEFGYPIQNIYARFLLANTVFHLPKY
jgi:hypothetical protein